MGLSEEGDGKEGRHHCQRFESGSSESIGKGRKGALDAYGFQPFRGCR